MAIDARGLVHRFRETYVNLHNLWSQSGRKPVGAHLRDPGRHPIDPDTFPPGLKHLLEEYQARHPGISLGFYKFAHSVDGEPVDVIEDATGLPDEDHLLCVSQTVTLLATDSVRVVTDLYVARLRESDEAPVQLRRRKRNA